MSENDRDHIAMIGEDVLKNLPRPGVLGHTMVEPFCLTYHGVAGSGSFCWLYAATDEDDCRRAFETVHSWLTAYRRAIDCAKTEA